MNENIDLTEILKGCPKGTELYSTIYGKVRFERINDYGEYPIEIKVINKFTNPSISVSSAYFVKDGRCSSNYDGECTLFPAKDQRDWSKFERFWDKPKVEKFDVNTLQTFDRILVRFSGNLNWQIGLFGYKYEKLIYSNGTVYYQCVPYNDETKHLIGTTNDCPDYYKWWEE